MQATGRTLRMSSHGGRCANPTDTPHLPPSRGRQELKVAFLTPGRVGCEAGSEPGTHSRNSEPPDLTQSLDLRDRHSVLVTLPQR